MSPERLKKICGNLAPGAWRLGQQAEVTPSVQIKLDRQPPAVLDTEAVQQLFKVGVALPLNAVQVAAILNIQPDQITSTAMIRAENQPTPFQGGESLLDIGSIQIGTIAAYDDNFRVAEIGHGLDCIFQPFSERRASLAVDGEPRLVGHRKPGRRKDMNINFQIGPQGEIITLK